MFDRYVRGRVRSSVRPRTERKAGVGLGLFIACGLVAAQNGSGSAKTKNDASRRPPKHTPKHTPADLKKSAARG